MKQTAIIGVAAVAAIGIGASTFLLVRGSSSTTGAASRDEIATRAIAGLNDGDAAGLLAILVGPDSDARAADCEQTSNDAARAKRVADGLAIHRPAGLVIDHLGNDRSEVLHEKGGTIAGSCTARATIVKHSTTLALHDATGAKFVADLTALEIAGRWFLTQVPVATPEAAVQKWVEPKVFEPGELTGTCATLWQTQLALRSCAKASAEIRADIDNIEMNVTRLRREGWEPGDTQADCATHLRELQERFSMCELGELPVLATGVVNPATRNKVMFKTFNAMDAGNRDALRALFATDGCGRVADDVRDQRIAAGLAATIRELAFDRIRKDVASELCPGVTKHVLTQQFHMPDGTIYSGEMVELESAGTWYLAELPIAKKVPASRPTDFVNRDTSDPSELVLGEASFAPGELTPICATWWKQALAMRKCVRVVGTKVPSLDAYSFFVEAIDAVRKRKKVLRADADCREDLEMYANSFRDCR